MTMIETPYDVIETPSVAARTEKTALLADVLSHVRLSGALFLLGDL